MRKFSKDYVANDDVIEKCEKDWFYSGHSTRAIQGRIKFFHYYKEEFPDYIKQYGFVNKYKLGNIIGGVFKNITNNFHGW